MTFIKFPERIYLRAGPTLQWHHISQVCRSVDKQTHSHRNKEFHCNVSDLVFSKQKQVHAEAAARVVEFL